MSWKRRRRRRRRKRRRKRKRRMNVGEGREDDTLSPHPPPLTVSREHAARSLTGGIPPTETCSGHGRSLKPPIRPERCNSTHVLPLFAAENASPSSRHFLTTHRGRERRHLATSVSACSPPLPAPAALPDARGHQVVTGPPRQAIKASRRERARRPRC
ncbi:unnamed protein product [Pleuronectes platessa]|uniref:Uncharacterized protein n=1 Tax=Pleuronectes platessa TaxID=8262 RepID=A0A9N7U8U9_PLEPL|nr:unnamed protein product [Pleuronectes platessa]